MKISTATMPITAARTPERIESAPSDGPTVRSSRYLMLAGRAPERRIIERSLACCSVMRPPLIEPWSRIGFLDVGHFLHFVVEHHGQAVANVSGSEAVEPLPALAGEREADAGLAILIAAGLRIAQIFAAHRRNARHQVPRLPLCRAPGALCPGSRIASGGQHAARLRLQRRLLARIRPAQRLLDLQHGGGLHDVLHAPRIVHARQLHQNLILPESVFLNGGLADAESVNAVADGLDGLGDRLVLQVSQRCGFIARFQELSGPPVMSYSGKPLLHDAQQVGRAPRLHAFQHDVVGIVLRVGLGDVA